MKALENVDEVKEVKSGPTGDVLIFNEIIKALNKVIEWGKEQKPTESPINMMVLREDYSDWMIVQVDAKIIENPARGPNFNSYTTIEYNCAICYCDCDSGGGSGEMVGDV